MKKPEVPYVPRPRPRLTLWIEAQVDRCPPDSRWFYFLFQFLIHLPELVIGLLGVSILLFREISSGVILAAAIVLAVAGILYYVNYRQSRQRLIWQIAGRCVDCGYDLRASPVRCPECGRVHGRAVRGKRAAPNLHDDGG